MISYEAALGLSVVAVILMSGSLSTHDIVAAQADRLLVDWNVVQTAIVPFFIFCVAATAELNRPPFDFAEAEQEIVAGFHTEYSAIRFGMFYLAEFMNVITMSAIIVTLFMGGPSGPIGPGPEQLYPPLWFLLKLVVFLWLFVWTRGTLPRFRYDQLMDLGWKRLIPAALVWLMFLATVQVGRDQDWDWWVAPFAGIALTFTTFILMSAGLRTSRLSHDERAKAGIS
jgi:NADH-quinone oxidoreductase subunit H